MLLLAAALPAANRRPSWRRSCLPPGVDGAFVQAAAVAWLMKVESPARARPQQLLKHLNDLDLVRSDAMDDKLAALEQELLRDDVREIRGRAGMASQLCASLACIGALHCTSRRCYAAQPCSPAACLDGPAA
jgi:hypothetical protein